MRGYRDGTTSIDDDGWLHTDDSGTWLEDGRLHVVGRRGDVIVTGGHKVWPESVERSLAHVINPEESCIVGLDDEEWGERVVLVTTRRDLRLDDVREQVGRTLPGYCAPREIRVVDEIPRTALGKIRRRELRENLSSSN